MTLAIIIFLAASVAFIGGWVGCWLANRFSKTCYRRKLKAWRKERKELNGEIEKWMWCYKKANNAAQKLLVQLDKTTDSLGKMVGDPNE